MTTYAEMKAQAEAMMAQAEAVRKEEMATVIREIKEKMVTYGLTVADLGQGNAQSASTKKPAKSKSTAPAKYRGPNGETWAGGMGRKPQWVVALVAEGKDLSDYLIDKADHSTAAVGADAEQPAMAQETAEAV